MKKNILIAGFVLLCMASCHKNEINDNIPAPKGEYLFTINAGVETSEKLKTSYTDDTYFLWSAGDEISVLFHNGTENKYFTLKTDTGGSYSAKFSGLVTEGWTEGAADGAKVALYPANNSHEYRPDDAKGYKVWFNIPSEIDFTASGAHSSVNIPMQALNTGEGYTFTNLSCCYKFSFKVSSEVKKVKFTAENTGNGYYLSGLAPIRHDAGEYLQFYDGTGSKIISLIENVGNDNIVTFYLPSRIYHNLEVKISLKNMTEGAIGYSLGEYSAKKGLSSVSTKMVVLPTADLSAKGKGTAFTSNYGIDWDNVSVSGSLSDDLGSIKAAADADYVYVYTELDASRISAGTAYGTQFVLYLGNDSSASKSWMWSTTPNTYEKNVEGWLFTGGIAKISCWTDPYKDAHAEVINGTYYAEIRLDRSKATYFASGKAHVGICVYYEKTHDGTSSQGGSSYKYGPTGGSILEIDMP